MSDASVFREKAAKFDEQADSTEDPLYRQHCRELAAYYRRLLIDHLEARAPENADQAY